MLAGNVRSKDIRERMGLVNCPSHDDDVSLGQRVGRDSEQG
jgi:hypothetical protein